MHLINQMSKVIKNKPMTIFDISLPLKNGMIVYPNNPDFTLEKMSTGHSTISKITMGTHTGTHFDFPKHVIEDGKSSSDFFEHNQIFFQECQVLDMTDAVDKITDADLKQKQITTKVVLLKTKNSLTGYEFFREDYIYLDRSAAQYLDQLNLQIVGIDFLSVKQAGSVDNSAHTVLLKKDILILEGINLASVEEGNYFFCGFPLKIAGADGAPARVVLIDQ